MVSHYYPERERAADTAVIIANSFNGSVERGFGRKAQEIANTIGAQVLAYDRDGTGNRYTVSLSLHHNLVPSRAVQHVATIGRLLDNELDTTTKSVVLYGHSGAGPEMAALARTELLPAFALGLSDPVGVRKLNFVQGVLGGALYTRNYEWPAKQGSPNGHTESKGSVFRCLRNRHAGRAILEACYYSSLWASDFTVKSIQELAEKQPELGIYTAFASSSLVGKTSFVQSLIEHINSLRTDTASAPVVATVVPNTLHSSFEDPTIASTVVLRTIGLVAPESFAA
ncbi:MAG TPA: hypothetical protein VFI84_02920 [Candidatus Saccharimonadales bacterium]|nr:hypothetical protein [Candidatus Saccharimonadales bacterium]